MTEESAMVTVRANCPDCGDVEMMTNVLRLLHCSSTGDFSYAFRCPSCLLQVAKPAGTRIVEALGRAGVGQAEWCLPAELAEVRAGAPISHDDLLAFHCLLETDHWQRHLRSDNHLHGDNPRSS
ncbi:MAG: hypothetical protein M3R71_02790 [Actinomycetota bacterium]|nr:hypothetical protein [Actinomycetota bacterium]